MSNVNVQQIGPNIWSALWFNVSSLMTPHLLAMKSFIMFFVHQIASLECILITQLFK